MNVFFMRMSNNGEQGQRLTPETVKPDLSEVCATTTPASQSFYICIGVYLYLYFYLYLYLYLYLFVFIILQHGIRCVPAERESEPSEGQEEAQLPVQPLHYLPPSYRLSTNSTLLPLHSTTHNTALIHHQLAIKN